MIHNPSTVTVLHLSDLHFGGEAARGLDETARAERKLAFDALLGRLSDLAATSWKPEVVVVSGDIGWRGSGDDYRAATDWFAELSAAVGVAFERFICTPGNHDLDHTACDPVARPADAAAADDALELEQVCSATSPLVPFFRNFQAFCADAGIPPLRAGNRVSSLVGMREVLGLRFVVLNSCWYCRGADADKGRLWLGLPQLRVMDADGQLGGAGREDYDQDPVTIAVVHHPPGWLDDQEIHPYPERTAAWPYLARRCHMILTGHVHGAPPEPDRVADRALHFNSGATYTALNYRNHLSILRVDRDRREVSRKVLELDPSSVGRLRWTESESRPYSLLAPAPAMHGRPEVLNLPAATCSKLIGRDEDLERGLRALASPSKRFLAITGFGGIGKTSLARELVERLRHSAQVVKVIWETSKTETFDGVGVAPSPFSGLTDNELFRSIAEHSGRLEEFLKEKSRSRRLTVLHRILEHEGCYVVLDNLETVKDYRHFVSDLAASFSRCRFILTCRHKLSDYDFVFPLELPCLTEQAGLAFLRAELTERGFTIEASDDELRRIYEATGGLPLAMKLVVGQVVAGGQELGRLLDRLATVEHGASRDESSVYSFYTFIYRATWEMMSDSAKRVLLFMITLPGTMGTPVEEIRESSGMEPSEVDAAVVELNRFSLLERSETGTLSRPEYFLHPLTANFVSSELLGE